MIDAQSCRQYAADCVRQAHNEESVDDRNILLNVALAWIRLGSQTQELSARLAGNEESENGETTDTEPPVLAS
jgi:hypothetical protein